MELLEKLPDVTVKGDGAELVKHVSSGSAKQNHRSSSCRVAAPRSMKTASPLGQGGTSGGLEWVVRPAFPNPSRQPPEGFTTAPVVSPSFPLW